MSIYLDPRTCQDLAAATSREWLVTNGIGGYASGTVSGILTRRYHGLLLAALNPPLARTLLLAKLDEVVTVGDTHYAIAANRWADGVIDPMGYRYLEAFYLEGTVPHWIYQLGSVRLEKRVWMQPRANTTYITYTVKQAPHPVSLTLKALVNYRDHHGESQPWPMQVVMQNHGVCIRPTVEAQPFYLLVDRGKILPTHNWYYNYDLDLERYRGLGDRDNHLHAATVEVPLAAGDMLTVVASTDADPNLNGAEAHVERQTYAQTLLDQWQEQINPPSSPPWIQQLVLAADQFIVDRPLEDEPEGQTIIAGYPWFGDWGRDTMISLPGLTLATGRPAIARMILQTFARYLSQGMLPNVFPERGTLPEYNTVDAILWYFEAVRAYHAHTDDDELLARLFPVLADVIAWHCRGTRYQIHLDQDGLIYAGEAGVQLTWMDAKVGDWVVTPRVGKPIEISALWYNALRCMEQFAIRLKKPTHDYQQMAERTLKGFQRFWNSDSGYCYDVLDGPDGDDTALRPNQLFAISLPYAGGHSAPLLWTEQQKSILEVCQQFLLTPYGLRSLAPGDPQYEGHYGGNQYERDRVYHQGTVWGWLLGPYLQAHLHVYQTPKEALDRLGSISEHLMQHGLGSMSEIFDGDEPFPPRGCFAQAWSVAEILRVWSLLQTSNAGR